MSPPIARSAPLLSFRSTSIAVVAALLSGLARAADPQSYTVAIAPTGQGDLDAALKAAAQLESLQPGGPIAPFALVGRARQDVGRLETVLQGFGYYEGKATVTVLGRPVDDPGLATAIEALPAGTAASVAITIETGPLYRLREVRIEGEIPEDARSRLGVRSGDPAVAAEVLRGQERLLTALQEDGYALARVDPPVAYADPAARVLDVTYAVRAGPRVDIGAISITGLHDVHEDFVSNRLLVHSGERYSPSRIEKARQDLLSLGVFSGVTVRAAGELDAQGRMPLTFDVQERPPRAVGLTGAYSTDLGASAKATWSHRNLFGNAEQLNLSAGISGIGGSATTGLGYNLNAQFIKPDFEVRDQTLTLNAAAVKQKLDAYDQDAILGGATLGRKLSDVWTGSIGVTAEREHIVQQSVGRDYTLLGLPVSARYDSTGLVNPLEDPLHGIRGTIAATPIESLGANNATFVVIQLNGAAYFDLAATGWTEPGRSVVALRGLIGTAQGASLFSLPPDQRFYGGGSATVRGYKYQSIGPQFPDGKPIGGTSIDAGTIEFRQRLSGNFGAAAFVDAGQVGESSRPFTGTVFVGAGLGLRYYTAIGPIRLDVAVPLVKQSGGDRFEIYIGLGQAF